MLTLCTGPAPSSYGGKEYPKVLSGITLGDAGLCELLQVSLGACLSGATENHSMLFSIGSGRNGKKTLGIWYRMRWGLREESAHLRL